MISREDVIEKFEYDKNTGNLIWKNSWRRAVKGEIAGYNARGYRATKIDGKIYWIHRLVWLLHNGSLPSCGFVIDHINGKKSDNRIENLRAVTVKQNIENSGVSKNNKVGYKGVHVRNGKYFAQIKHNYKVYRLGAFDSATEAFAAYEEAASQMFTHYKRIGVA